MDSGSDFDRKKLPISVITIGMAGSGKTTLMQRMISHLSANKIPRYIVNVSSF
jgi:GPN-loop GTPase